MLLPTLSRSHRWSRSFLGASVLSIRPYLFFFPAHFPFSPSLEHSSLLFLLPWVPRARSFFHSGGSLLGVLHRVSCQLAPRQLTLSFSVLFEPIIPVSLSLSPFFPDVSRSLAATQSEILDPRAGLFLRESLG